MSMWKYRMPREVDYVNDKGNNFYNIGNTLYYQIAIGMKLLDSKVAKKELKEYNLYDVTKKQYERITKIVNEELPRFIKTNEYYNSL